VTWPTATDYNEAVQDLRQSMSDEELRAGQAAVNPLDLPMIWSGNFADVYKIHNAKSGNTWALKCFTRKIAGQADRYQHISAHLDRARLPFMVDFKYLDQGIRIHGEWYPALKMRWVEGGIPLNQFVEQYLNRPRMLKDLLSLWVKMAGRLRQTEIAHADLQHGNVLLVPRADRRLALKLIDYDGMYVPALSGSRSPELGHPAFQHPQRGREGIYSAEVDRFSNLAIYSAIHCLTVGRETVWKRFNNDDNLLFREDDFRSPADSDVFQTLWHLPDADSRALVGRLILACTKPLDQSPLLDEVTNGQVFPLTSEEEAAVESILGSKTQTAPAAVVEPVETASPVPPSEGLTAEPQPSAEPEPTVKPLPDWVSLPETSESATPRRRRRWLSPLAVPRLFDRLLGKIVGEENVILHNFLRVLTVSGLLVLLIGFFVYGFFQALQQVGPSQPVARYDSVAVDRSDPSEPVEQPKPVDSINPSGIGAPPVPGTTKTETDPAEALPPKETGGESASTDAAEAPTPEDDTPPPPESGSEATTVPKPIPKPTPKPAPRPSPTPTDVTAEDITNDVVIHLPNPRAPPEGTAPILIICREGRIMIVDVDIIREKAQRWAENIVIRGGLNRDPAAGIDGKVLTREFNREPIKDRNFLVKMTIAGTIPKLVFNRVENSGESTKRLTHTNSYFQRRMKRVDVHKNYVQFLVWPDSFETYLEARNFCSKRNLMAGWQAQTTKAEYTIDLGGSIRVALPPKPRPGPAPVDVID
jgi:outer membrane biosynthesis protein TonB